MIRLGVKIKLIISSNYGSYQKIISDSTSVDQIKQTINERNWHNFHQVILTKKNDDWIEVGGNLNEDRLSATYEENGHQYVITRPPLSVDHMAQILILYYNGDGKFKDENKFE